MGAWGVKLNQNDVYEDVKNLYTALLRYCLSDDAALSKTLDSFAGYADDDKILLQLSLADVMYKLGRLTNEVRDNALHIIDSGADLDTWYQSSQEQGDARRDMLAALKDQLCGEQPAKKKAEPKTAKTNIAAEDVPEKKTATSTKKRGRPSKKDLEKKRICLKVEMKVYFKFLML